MLSASYAIFADFADADGRHAAIDFRLIVSPFSPRFFFFLTLFHIFLLRLRSILLMVAAIRCDAIFHAFLSLALR